MSLFYCGELYAYLVRSYSECAEKTINSDDETMMLDKLLLPSIVKFVRQLRN